MADGDGESVGGIGGVGGRVEMKQAGDHMLHLQLVSFAVAHHRRFDRERRVFRYRQACGRRRQHGNPTNLAELQRRLHIHGIEYIFNGNVIGPMLADNSLESVENFGKPLWHGITGKDSDRTRSAAVQLSAREQFDNTITGVFGTTVDAQNPHEGEFTLLLLDAD